MGIDNKMEMNNFFKVVVFYSKFGLEFSYTILFYGICF